MTHKLNDFKGTFLLGSIHQVLMNSWEGTNANANVGTGNGKWERQMERRRTRERERGKKRKRENYHRCDEWGWWQKPSGDHSVTETGFCGPNFIIMTQSHQHTPSDKSTAELGSRKDQLNWLGFSGLSQIERMARFYSGFRRLSRLPGCSLENLTHCMSGLYWYWLFKKVS